MLVKARLKGRLVVRDGRLYLEDSDDPIEVTLHVPDRSVKP